MSYISQCANEIHTGSVYGLQICSLNSVRCVLQIVWIFLGRWLFHCSPMIRRKNNRIAEPQQTLRSDVRQKKASAYRAHAYPAFLLRTASLANAL